MPPNRFALATAFLAFAIVAIVATPASALTPEKDFFAFSFHNKAPAGTLCDFNYRNTGSVEGFDVAFFDSDGNFVRDVSHFTATITHINRDTGYTLTEVDTLNSAGNESTNVGRTVGIQWHLRDPDGKIVLTVAGLITYRLDPFKIISITPRVDRFFDFPEVICPLLGGSPA